MPVFLERFVLPLIVAGWFAVAITNPFALTWQLRVVISCLLVAVALGVAFLVHRSRSKPSRIASAPVAEPLPQPALPTVGGNLKPAREERVFVHTATASLVAMLEGKTSLEQARIERTYKGKWLRVSGKVRDVGEDMVRTDDGYVDSIKVVIRPSGGPNLYMHFVDNNEQSRAIILQKEDSVTADGCIHGIAPSAIFLGNCHFIEVQPPPPASAPTSE